MHWFQKRSTITPALRRRQKQGRVRSPGNQSRVEIKLSFRRVQHLHSSKGRWGARVRRWVSGTPVFPFALPQFLGQRRESRHKSASGTPFVLRFINSFSHPATPAIWSWKLFEHSLSSEYFPPNLNLKTRKQRNYFYKINREKEKTTTSPSHYMMSLLSLYVSLSTLWFKQCVRSLWCEPWIYLHS